jgi:hypothetical protein
VSRTLDTIQQGFQWVIYRDQLVAYVTPDGFQLVAELRARPETDPYRQFAHYMAKYGLSCVRGQLSWGYSDEDARMFARCQLVPRELQERPLPDPSRTAFEIGVPIHELLDTATWFTPGEVGRGVRPDPTIPAGRRAARRRRLLSRRPGR